MAKAAVEPFFDVALFGQGAITAPHFAVAPEFAKPSRSNKPENKELAKVVVAKTLVTKAPVFLKALSQVQASPHFLEGARPP